MRRVPQLAQLRPDEPHLRRPPEDGALRRRGPVQLRHLLVVLRLDGNRGWTLSTAGDWDGLVEDLLVEHYDPAYLRSMRLNYPRYDSAAGVELDGVGEADFAAAATRIVAEYGG